MKHTVIISDTLEHIENCISSRSPTRSFRKINCFSPPFSHTKGHISYYVTGKEGEDPAVFTGDTLVSGDLDLLYTIF